MLNLQTKSLSSALRSQLWPKSTVFKKSRVPHNQQHR